MKEVNITQLRQHLPAYLAEARRGVTLRITSRGRAIAEITPPSVDADKVAAARALLRGSVVRFDDPLVPALDPGEWASNR